jgi:cytochrome P450
LEPPGPVNARYVTRDVELHGQTVPAGSAMLCMVGAANRDPRRYEDPDRFDIHRKRSMHLTFILGPHYCLGSALARLEGRVALEEILQRWPSWEVDWDEAKLQHTSSVRG